MFYGSHFQISNFLHKSVLSYSLWALTSCASRDVFVA